MFSIFFSAIVAIKFQPHPCKVRNLGGLGGFTSPHPRQLHGKLAVACQLGAVFHAITDTATSTDPVTLCVLIPISDPSHDPFIAVCDLSILQTGVG
jgi:hypothetical protein